MNCFAPLFLSHGSPMTALEPRQAGAFMQQLGATLRQDLGMDAYAFGPGAPTLAAALQAAG